MSIRGLERRTNFENKNSAMARIINELIDLIFSVADRCIRSIHLLMSRCFRLRGLMLRRDRTSSLTLLVIGPIRSFCNTHLCLTKKSYVRSWRQMPKNPNRRHRLRRLHIFIYWSHSLRCLQPDFSSRGGQPTSFANDLI